METGVERGRENKDIQRKRAREEESRNKENGYRCRKRMRTEMMGKKTDV